jgi:hypothetical protein
LKIKNSFYKRGSPRVLPSSTGQILTLKYFLMNNLYKKIKKGENDILKKLYHFAYTNLEKRAIIKQNTRCLILKEYLSLNDFINDLEIKINIVDKKIKSDKFYKLKAEEQNLYILK